MAASDILFRSPTVITGSESAPPFVADVLVSNGLITRIGEPGSIESGSARCIEAKGFYLSPGFIDMHAHSDLYLLTHPEHEAKITQGCTVSKGMDPIPFTPLSPGPPSTIHVSSMQGIPLHPKDHLFL